MLLKTQNQSPMHRRKPLSSSGFIRLVNSDMRQLAHRRYFCRKEREVIIDKWKQIYGQGYYSMSYIITPTINEKKTILEDKRHKAVQLKQNNWSISDISKFLGISVTTVRNYLTEHRIRDRQLSELSHLLV
jgi:hypothetical protein